MLRLHLWPFSPLFSLPSVSLYSLSSCCCWNHWNNYKRKQQKCGTGRARANPNRPAFLPPRVTRQHQISNYHPPQPSLGFPWRSPPVDPASSFLHPSTTPSSISMHMVCVNPSHELLPLFSLSPSFCVLGLYFDGAWLMPFDISLFILQRWTRKGCIESTDQPPRSSSTKNSSMQVRACVLCCVVCVGVWVGEFLAVTCARGCFLRVGLTILMCRRTG